MTSHLSLSVVVIARNEERTIGPCLSACLEAVRCAEQAGLIAPAEVVLVDSASTDRTREIATAYQVRIISLPKHWPLSAAAGRFVGLRESASEVVLWVDGDYVLDPEWLAIALRALERPDVAGVCGVDREALLGTTGISRFTQRLLDCSTPSTDVVETDGLAVGLYRRSWIDRAGGVNPFLKGAEDRDLAIRVQALGGRFLKTRAVMGTHHWAPGEDLNLTEYFRSVVRWSYGEGQAIRSAASSRIRGLYLRRYANARHLIHLEMGLVVFAWATAILAAFVLGRPVLAIAFVVVFFAVVGLRAALLASSFRDALFELYAIPYTVFRLGAFVMGYFDRPPPASEYPEET